MSDISQVRLCLQLRKWTSWKGWGVTLVLRHTLVNIHYSIYIYICPISTISPDVCFSWNEKNEKLMCFLSPHTTFSEASVEFPPSVSSNFHQGNTGRPWLMRRMPVDVILVNQGILFGWWGEGINWFWGLISEVFTCFMFIGISTKSTVYSIHLQLSPLFIDMNNIVHCYSSWFWCLMLWLLSSKMSTRLWLEWLGLGVVSPCRYFMFYCWNVTSHSGGSSTRLRMPRVPG